MSVRQLDIKALFLNLRLLIQKPSLLLKIGTDFVVCQPKCSSEAIGPVTWSPVIGTYLAVNFNDGFYVGEVVSMVRGTKVRVDYMHPKEITTVDDACEG